MLDINFITFTEEDFYEGTPEEFPLLEELAFESSVPVPEAEKVKNPIMEAEEALFESQKRLAFLENQAKMAAQEAAILDEVRKVNSLIRKATVEMGDQRLLPRQMEERREAAAESTKQIDDLLADLGF